MRLNILLERARYMILQSNPLKDLFDEEEKKVELRKSYLLTNFLTGIIPQRHASILEQIKNHSDQEK